MYLCSCALSITEAQLWEEFREAWHTNETKHAQSLLSQDPVEL